MRVVALIVAMVGVLTVGCSSSSNSNICCITINGQSSAFSCPTQAAYDACCGSDEATPGCVTDPINPAAASCTTVSFSAECS